MAKFAVPLLPDRPRKRSRLAPEVSSEEFLSDCFHNEQINLARSQGNAHLSIVEPGSSHKDFGNLLCKVSEESKCLVNRHAKLAAKNLRVANKGQKDAAVATKAVADMPPTEDINDTEMTADPNADSAFTITKDSTDLTTTKSRVDTFLFCDGLEEGRSTDQI